MARLSRLRVLRSSVGSPHAQPHAQEVVARWKVIMKSSAFSIEASTYSAPSTARRMGKPLSNNALSSDIWHLLRDGAVLPATIILSDNLALYNCLSICECSD